MKTVDEFYNKYGTGINYEDLFAMRCRAKMEQNPVLAYDVEEFINDLREVCNNDFDELLWRDYQFITNIK